MATTSKTAFELARNYRNAAGKIDDYLVENFDELSEGERQRLAMLSTTLYQAGNTAAFAAAERDLDDMRDVAPEVKRVTARMAAAVDRFDDVEKVIEATTSAIALVGALAAADAPSILAAAKSLGSKVDALAIVVR